MITIVIAQMVQHAVQVSPCFDIYFGFLYGIPIPPAHPLYLSAFIPTRATGISK